jgi:DNA primase catalytic subunit
MGNIFRSSPKSEKTIEPKAIDKSTIELLLKIKYMFNAKYRHIFNKKFITQSKEQPEEYSKEQFEESSEESSEEQSEEQSKEQPEEQSKKECEKLIKYLNAYNISQDYIKTIIRLIDMNKDKDIKNILDSSKLEIDTYKTTLNDSLDNLLNILYTNKVFENNIVTYDIKKNINIDYPC